MGAGRRRRDAPHRAGPRGQEDDGVRWVAVRHGADHVHIVAMLARQDFRRPQLRNDRYRVRDACLAAERRYGLRSTAPADRTAARRPTRAESGKAARRHLRQEFFARLEAAGVLARKRFSLKNQGQVTGYAIALPGDTGKDGSPVWYGGGKLAADLTWPRLTQRWTRPGGAPGSARFTAAERRVIWEHAAQAVADAAAQIRLVSGTNPAAAADAAWATSDTLHVAAAALGSHILAQAADAYDRAARHPGGRIPPPTPAGNQLRQAARLISALASLAKDPALAPLMLITRLAALAFPGAAAPGHRPLAPGQHGPGRDSQRPARGPSAPPRPRGPRR